MSKSETKKALIAAGLEVYRTVGDVIHIADRVRENLIMDSLVRVDSARLAIVVQLRARRSDFPKDTEESLYDRARELAEPTTKRGYVETGTLKTDMDDPNDRKRVLDSWFEVLMEKTVESLDEAIEEVRFAMTINKSIDRAGE